MHGSYVRSDVTSNAVARYTCCRSTSSSPRVISVCNTYIACKLDVTSHRTCWLTDSSVPMLMRHAQHHDTAACCALFRVVAPALQQCATVACAVSKNYFRQLVAVELQVVVLGPSPHIVELQKLGRLVAGRDDNVCILSAYLHNEFPGTAAPRSPDVTTYEAGPTADPWMMLAVTLSNSRCHAITLLHDTAVNFGTYRNFQRLAWFSLQ